MSRDINTEVARTVTLLPPEVKAKLAALAVGDGRSLSNYIAKVLTNHANG